jgi:biopolymer transport protein ExbD
MAETQVSDRKCVPGVARSKKLSTRVDLTPMVDLGFLLISFFIVTTTWSQPRVMPLVMPSPGDSSKLENSVALTIIITGTNKIFYYQGQLPGAVRNKNYGFADYASSGGIRKIIEAKQVELDKTRKGGRNELMILIKATPDASYAQVLNLLDEMAIDLVKRYSLTEITDGERTFLQQRCLIN